MKMAKPYGIGVIGTGSRSGSIGRNLVKDKRNLADIVAICDVRPSAIESYERKVVETLGHTCKHYTDYQEMLRDRGVDIVIISTPDYMHYIMALDAIHAGKHVFLEKPVGLYLDQMIEIITAAKESGKILEIGYVLRYSPFYAKIKEMLDNGDIGRPMFAQALEEYKGAYHFNRGWWRKKRNTGGIMVQKICHDFDLFTWMFGVPKRVSAFTSINEFKPGNWDSDAKYCSKCENHCSYYVSNHGLNTRTYSDECVYNSDHDVADNAQIIMEFENGVNLSMGMVLGFNSPAQDDRFFKIIGSTAEISGQLSDQSVQFDPRFPEDEEEGSFHIKFGQDAAGGHGGGDQHQIIEFIEAISEGRESKAGLQAAYWSSIAVMSAQISADTGKTVDVREIIKQYPFPN